MSNEISESEAMICNDISRKSSELHNIILDVYKLFRMATSTIIIFHYIILIDRGTQYLWACAVVMQKFYYASPCLLRTPLNNSCIHSKLINVIFTIT